MRSGILTSSRFGGACLLHEKMLTSLGSLQNTVLVRQKSINVHSAVGISTLIIAVIPIELRRSSSLESQGLEPDRTPNRTSFLDQPPFRPTPFTDTRRSPLHRVGIQICDFSLLSSLAPRSSRSRFTALFSEPVPRRRDPILSTWSSILLDRIDGDPFPWERC